MSPLFKWQPNARDVAGRMLCLASVFRRGYLEDSEAEGAEDEREKLRLEMIGWLSQAGVLNFASKLEKEYFFRVPVGDLDPQAQIDAAWRLESLGVLSWAVGLREMLPYDVQFPVIDFGPAFPFGSPPPVVKTFISGVRLRPLEEIGSQRDIAEAWNWRSRTTRLQQEGAVQPPAGLTFEKIIEMSAEAHHAEGHMPAPIGGDYPAFGKPYRELSPDEYSIATSIAMERHYTLNWLCGYSKDWDRVPTGT